MSHFTESTTAVATPDDQSQGMIEETSSQAETYQNEINLQTIDEAEFTTPRRDVPADELNVDNKTGDSYVRIVYFQVRNFHRMVNSTFDDGKGKLIKFFTII